MSTVTIKARPSNGVSFGFSHKVLSTETGTATIYIIDFGPDAPNDCYLVGIVHLLRSGAEISVLGAKVSAPAPGQLKFDCNGGVTLVADDVLYLIAARDTGDLAVVSSAYVDENPTFTDQAPDPKVFAIN